VVVISAQIERELAELPDEEASEFLADLGLERSGLERLIHAGYRVLGLITFLTASEKEVRAWTVRRGATAPQAAGVIHSDFERGFIRAEVIHWTKLREAGGMVAARARGWVRTEGKGYVVEDGDVIHFCSTSDAHACALWRHACRRPQKTVPILKANTPPGLRWLKP
jgi:ribosome-binding ATPase